MGYTDTMRRVIFIIFYSMAAACQTITGMSEKSSMMEVKSIMNRFDKAYSSTLHGEKNASPCRWQKVQDPKAIMAAKIGRYFPDSGIIEYPQGDYDAFQHEVQHYFNWQSKASWSCLDEYSAYLVNQLIYEKQRRMALESKLRMR